ncbi:ribosomal protein S6, partial [Phellopilus nigrolimitatus]
MPLYKMFCIAAHYPEYRHIKDLVSQSATLLLERGSTVRQIQYLGTRNLPQRMRRHKHYHAIGDYWTMHFDAPPRLLAQLSERMRTDPRVVRWTMLRLGERLEDVVAADRARTVGDAD